MFMVPGLEGMIKADAEIPEVRTGNQSGAARFWLV